MKGWEGQRLKGGMEAARGGTNIDRVDVAVMIGIHVTIWKEAIWKEREEDKFGKGEEFVAREGEAHAPGMKWSVWRWWREEFRI